MVVKVDADLKQKLTFYVSVLGECFKVFMACLLSLFVPQWCEETQDVCTIDENVSDLTSYNTAVVVWNFLTLGAFVYLYYIDTGNETWMINKFDQDRTKPDNYLQTNLGEYVEHRIGEKLERRNYKVFKTYLTTTIFYGINIILSAILVLHFYYYDVKTITALITNSLLVIDKLVNGLSISRRAMNEKAAISLYSKEPVMYNVIDADYMKKLKPAIVLETTGVEIGEEHEMGHEESIVNRIEKSNGVEGECGEGGEGEGGEGVGEIGSPVGTAISSLSSSVIFSTGSSATAGRSSQDNRDGDAIDLASVSVGAPATERDMVTENSSDAQSDAGSINNTSLDITQIVAQISLSHETKTE